MSTTIKKINPFDQLATFLPLTLDYYINNGGTTNVDKIPTLVADYISAVAINASNLAALDKPTWFGMSALAINYYYDPNVFETKGSRFFQLLNSIGVVSAVEFDNRLKDIEKQVLLATDISADERDTLLIGIAFGLAASLYWKTVIATPASPWWATILPAGSTYQSHWALSAMQGAMAFSDQENAGIIIGGASCSIFDVIGNY